MMCRSPLALAPPSIRAFAGSGYGPRSLSEAYWKVTLTFAWPAGTFVIGMPNGAPSYVPAPKSGCTWPLVPMLATYLPEAASTGSRETSACQTLSAGKMVQALAAAVGLGEAVAVAEGRDADGVGDALLGSAADAV